MGQYGEALRSSQLAQLLREENRRAAEQPPGQECGRYGAVCAMEGTEPARALPVRCTGKVCADKGGKTEAATDRRVGMGAEARP